MTRYEDDFPYPTAFAPEHPTVTLPTVIAQERLPQLHVAETEKYAHVTYFFNGGEEAPCDGERRVLVPSARDVATYDAKPEMSAPQIAAAFTDSWRSDSPAFAVINFANADMVGHTGVIPAAKHGIETIDGCLAQVIETVHASGGTCLITADHGNAEKMLEEDGVSPHTAHTTNLVPLILTEKGVTLRPGELSDLIPTALALLGVGKPAEMTGQDLVNPA
jgi:2,3-bisphosphoglycerate-independent phosphoglycerate mutase